MVYRNHRLEYPNYVCVLTVCPCEEKKIAIELLLLLLLNLPTVWQDVHATKQDRYLGVSHTEFVLLERQSFSQHVSGLATVHESLWDGAGSKDGISG